MAIEIQQRRQISAGATRVVSFSLEKWLGSLPGTQTLVGTPTVVEVTTTDLTINNKSINSATLRIDDEDVEAGKAVQFLVAVPAGKEGTNYRVRITVTSSGSPAESEPMDVILECV